MHEAVLNQYSEEPPTQDMQPSGFVKNGYIHVQRTSIARAKYKLVFIVYYRKVELWQSQRLL